ncbi:RNA-binding protein 1-like [Aristolochia californica]|uniref:RNA-binding protein 1-like n=1 Tax=Aristolochia californica TaxID=171875 RepID=UPI0035D58B32
MMGDNYWRYGDGRQPAIVPPTGKRTRSEYDVPADDGFSTYYPQEKAAPRVVRDSQSIGASYDLYLRSGQISSHGAGDSGRAVTGGMTGRPVDDPRMMASGAFDPGMGGVRQNLVFGGGKPDQPLPPDASNTLFVEGFPANCTRREVSHIFRPFVGFKEVRLVTKESRHPGGAPIVLCFVDFSSSSNAAIALDVLQGYKFDEQDRDSAVLRLQFARFPGPRSGGGPRGKR